MGTHSHWFSRLAWAGVALALLAWHGQARAACESDIVDAMVFESAAPATEHSLPCCAARAGTVLATESLRTGATPSAGAAITGWPSLDGWIAATLREPRLPDHPWRPYCARSARLLR